MISNTEQLVFTLTGLVSVKFLHANSIIFPCLEESNRAKTVANSFS